MQLHVFAMRMAIAIEPGSFVITCRIDDQGVSLPMTNRPTVPDRIQIFGKLSSVRIDLAQTETETISRLEYLQYLAGRLNELDVPSSA